MEQQLASLTSLTFDRDLYGGVDRDAYETSIPATDDEEPEVGLNEKLMGLGSRRGLLIVRMITGGGDWIGLFRRRGMILFLPGENAGSQCEDLFGYHEGRVFEKAKEELLRKLPRKKEEEEARAEKGDKGEKESDSMAKRRNRWDQSMEDGGNAAKKAKTGSDWDLPDATPGIGRWDATPTPGRMGMLRQVLGGRIGGMRLLHRGEWLIQMPLLRVGLHQGRLLLVLLGILLPKECLGGATPGPTPLGAIDMATPTPNALAMRGAITPEQYNLLRWEKDIEERNRPLTDEELDAMFPQEGSTRFWSRRLLIGQQFDLGQEPPAGLPFMKPEDYQYFGALLNEEDEEELSPEEQKERKIMKLLLKVKNGTPPQRKTALRQLTDKAREFGAGPLFNRILPLLMQPTLEDQEGHRLVKIIDRVLYKLDELVRPYVHKILVVIEPLLIDEDYYARVEGREIISNLSKAAGLATMIAAMRPDIDNIDEYVRNTTARAFSVVASALGIPALLPFLKAVCQSKKSWQARHTGIKIVQQIAILIGCAVLPHLRSLVEIIEHGLNDENQKVRTITALSLAALAEASAPYGIGKL
ncbi:hypothetical protein H0E87_028488 [Populus deltoides]|uniref:Splicing factor 3B subunit 1 domain-containing protein n=1 Tax=Populus deltoides TaxID=3696 RepID=A0A8T2WTB0_POPDE|nr:hypothetical protein H0E87_028488 [Populus deltoides]